MSYRYAMSKRACCSGYNLSLRILHFRNSPASTITQRDTSCRSNPFSTSSTTINKGTTTNEKLRIAIVGGGVSGLSLALHLAPLAERGLISAPIDLYEKSSLESAHPHKRDEKSKDGAVKDENFHPGTGTIGRDIGVGVWSTALEPFLHCHDIAGKGKSKPRQAHINLIEKLMDLGQWVGNVGYRTPNGLWLTRNCLDTSGFKEMLSTASSAQSTPSSKDAASTKPGLLFLREKDFLTALRDAVLIEQDKGIIQTYYATSDSDGSTSVENIITPESGTQQMSGQLRFSDNSVSSPDAPYNLVVAADGINSLLRSKYGGDESPDMQLKQYKNGRTKYERTANCEVDQDCNTNALDDRRYTVFRGNSSLKDSELGTNGESFQTWGEQKSMRFAVVSMSHPSDDTTSDERVQKQVWFATTSISEISAIEDVEERKQRIMKCFSKWHHPIGDLIDSTPADEILMERAVAHKHAVYPVFNVCHIAQKSEKKNEGIGSFGSGPVLLFSGDANMAVDPVLAQGFTIAMETSADLARNLDLFLTSNGSNLSQFDTDRFRNLISTTNEQRFDRILCLLRATDLVQALAQPRTGSMVGFLSKNIVRPAINFAPNFLKKPAFAFVMKYSLGLFGNSAVADTTKTKNAEI